MLMLGLPMVAHSSPCVYEIERVGVRDLFNIAENQQNRVARERKKIRVIGRIGEWQGRRGFTLFEYSRWHVNGPGRALPVSIDLSSVDEQPEDWEFRPPVEWGKGVEVIGSLSFYPMADDPNKFAPILIVKPSETTPLGDLIKPAESTSDR
jgi:hypothetical protein